MTSATDIAAAVNIVNPSKRRNEGEDSKAKKQKINYGEVIQIKCGAQGEVFLAHKDTLCAISDYFKAACSKEWIEGQEGVILLPDIEPTTFQSFLHWTYTERFDMDHSKLAENPAKDCCCHPHLKYVSLWVAADYLGDRKLRNACIDAVYNKMRAHPGQNMKVPTIRRIINSTPAGSGPQRLVADFVSVWAGRVTEMKDVDELVERLPRFVVKVMAKQFYKAKDTMIEPRLGKLCDYHEHPDGEERCPSWYKEEDSDSEDDSDCDSDSGSSICFESD